MKADKKQRRRLQKYSLGNKSKKPVIKKAKDKTLILCPIKDVYIYRYICQTKCDYYLRQKCPKQEEIG